MFQEIKNAKNYELIIAQIRDMILNGNLKKGDKLPSERDLAVQMNVSRSSVREALIALQTTGIVEAKHGGGNFIRNNFEESLLEPLSLAFFLEKGSFDDLYQVRAILETEMAGVAAQNITEEEKIQLQDIITKIYVTEATETFLNSKLDRELHYTIAKASKNLIFVSIFNIITQIMLFSINYNREKILNSPDNEEKLVAIHRNICSKIIKNDVDGAKVAMKEHFDYVSKFINT